MKLTLGKKIGGSFVILVLISAISGGLIVYWLNSLTSTTQTVLSVRSPSMIGSERLLRFYGLAIGGIRGFLASGDEKINDVFLTGSELLAALGEDDLEPARMIHVLKEWL